MPDVTKARILVVDDDPSVQGWIKVVAEADGYHVSQAFDGRTALEMAEKASFALIVLDINMASLDGRDVLSRLKKKPETASVPVLVLSADASVHRRSVVIELGAEDVLEKPISRQSLVREIGSIIRKARDRTAD